MQSTLDATATENTATETQSIATTSHILTIATFDYRIHDAIITIHNASTGNHRTFKLETLRRSWNTGRRVLSLLIGPDNGNDYKAFAWINDDGIKVWERYCREIPQGESGRSLWEVYARMFMEPEYFVKRGAEYMIEARCRKCGHRLTHPDSITKRGGIGPECIKKT